MTQKARIRVDLNTKAGQAELRKLAKEGEASAGRVSDALGSGFGRAAALGAGAGVGFGLAQRAASRVGGFIPDVVSESFKPVSTFFDSSLGGPDARAAAGAREQTKAAYAEIIGRMKDPQVTPDIRNYYNNVRDLREITERGGAVIDKELGGEFIEDALTGIVGAIQDAGQRIIDAFQTGGK